MARRSVRTKKTRARRKPARRRKMAKRNPPRRARTLPGQGDLFSQRFSSEQLSLLAPRAPRAPSLRERMVRGKVKAGKKRAGARGVARPGKVLGRSKRERLPAWSPSFAGAAPLPSWMSAGLAQAPWMQTPAPGVIPPLLSEADADLVLAHSAEEGTTIRGDTRAWKEAIKGLNSGFKWWSDGGAWYRQQSRGRAAPSVPLERFARALRAAGATVYVVPTEAVTEAEARAVRQTHLRERAERLRGRAKSAGGKAAAAHESAEKLSERFYMGQPILVGHHSEAGARRDQARMWDLTRKGIDSAEKATKLKERALSAEHRAEALSEASIARALTVREWSETLAQMMSKRLKRDVPSVRTVRKRASSAGARFWALYDVYIQTETKGEVYLDIGVDSGLLTVNVHKTIAAMATSPEPESAYLKLAEFLNTITKR